MSDEPTTTSRGGAGPTDIRDDIVRQEAKRAAVWIGMAALAALVVYLAHPLLVIFGGFVFAMLIDGGQRLLGRVLPIGRPWRVAVVLLLTAAFLAWVVEFAGSQIMTQAAQMPPLITAQAQRVLDWASAHGLTMGRSDVGALVQQLLGGVGQVTQALGGLFGGVIAIFPNVWANLFTDVEAIRNTCRTYLQIVGPFYALFGLALCLYFASQGAGRVAWPVIASVVRVVVIALGCVVLSHIPAAVPEQFFWLIAAGMVVQALISGTAVLFGAWMRRSAGMPAYQARG
jgi:hypothetical protein